MVGLTATTVAPLRVPVRVGQRAMWLAYDVGLGLAVMATAGDIPFRWGLSPISWAAIYAAALLRILSVWPDYFRLLARNWVYLLYPAACLASVSWSVARGATLAGGTQVAMSALIACYLGWRFGPRQLMLLAFVTLSAGTFASLLNLTTGAFGGARFSAVGGLQGIYANKNTLGHTSLLLVLLSVTMMLMPRDGAPRLIRRLAPLTAIASAVAVVMSRSMTAVVLMPLFLFLAMLLNRRRLPAALRHGAIAVIVLVVALGPVLLTLAGLDPLALLFDATGKDATLTGRTELWSIAATEIAKAPLTGYGFGGFWVAPQFEAQRFEVLRAGATASAFHDVFADVGIGTGLIGIAAMLAMVLATLRRSLGFWRHYGGPLAVGCLVTALLPVTLSLAEPYLYRQHELMAAWLIMIGVSIGQRPGLAPASPGGTS